MGIAGKKNHICIRRSVVCVYISRVISSGSSSRLETCGRTRKNMKEPSKGFSGGYVYCLQSTVRSDVFVSFYAL